jgi:DNA-binding beta-propeller fold protein YncE
VAVAAVAASIAIGIVVGLGATTASDVGLGTSNELVEVSTSSGRTVDTLPLEGAPGAIAAAGDSLWVVGPDSAVVSRVSTSSDAVVDRIPVSGQPAEVAVAGGSVWVANTVGGEVSRIDPRTGTITQTVPLGGSLAAIASGRHELWVAEAGDRAVARTMRYGPVPGIGREKSVSPATRASASGRTRHSPMDTPM